MYCYLICHFQFTGSTSYVVSLPGLSHVIAVWNRAGWHLGGVLPCYISAEEGGDQNVCTVHTLSYLIKMYYIFIFMYDCVFQMLQVGRTVSGLPPGTTEFTMLPARFAADSQIEWSDIVPNYSSYPEGGSTLNVIFNSNSIIITTIKTDFRKVIPYLVAAVVHHSDWIASNLNVTHPLFLSRCWRQGSQESLKQHLIIPCCMACPRTGMSATGIPPVYILAHNQKELNQSMISAIEKCGTERPKPAISSTGN